MQDCYRVEVNSKSKYFKDKQKAVDYFCKKIKELKSCEFWVVHYEYSERMRMYTASQTLLDYYNPPKM